MASTANDRFEQYYSEKLWELIPPIYRDEDGRAENPGVLRAIVEIFARQAGVLRRSNDRLWDDAFIDLCDSWAVAYIGGLVGTRLVSALNLRGRRVDVAKTIYYRRRKGTLRVLEELISDIAGWEGKVVEEMRRLARTQHALDPKPPAYLGRFTGTPPGGWADLRRPRGAELTGTAFDEFFHAAEMRKAGGKDGRYAIPKIGFHLYRLPALRVSGVDPAAGPNNRAFTFDPSGRDIPLFMRRGRPEKFDWDNWRSAREWELPAPMRCRVLGHAEFVITEAVVLILIGAGLPAAAANDLRKLRGIKMPSEARLRSSLSSLPSSAALLAPAIYQPMIQQALIQDCGHAVLLPSSVPPASLDPKSVVVSAGGNMILGDRTVSGNLSAWVAAAPSKRLVIDPERGRFLFLGVVPANPVKVDYYYGFSGPIGAGSYDRRDSVKTPTSAIPPGGGAIGAAQIDSGTVAVPGVSEIADSSTYGSVASKANIQNAVIQAQNPQRPYLRLTGNWILNTGANTGALLTLEGLWIGAAGNFSVILRGDYETVVVRHCTLDPGGVDAQGNAIAPVPLAIEGAVANLIIDHSITGPIHEQNNGLVEKLMIEDSIVQSIAPGVTAIDLADSNATMLRTTVFGALNFDRLYASEALITGLATVTDTQDGCFRFGAALTGSRIPHPYESHYIPDSNYFFASREFGQPGYAQLSEAAPVFLLRGAENGSEIGAFSSFLNPIRYDSLFAKVEEYLPFGLIPVFLFET